MLKQFGMGTPILPRFWSLRIAIGPQNSFGVPPEESRYFFNRALQQHRP